MHRKSRGRAGEFARLSCASLACLCLLVALWPLVARAATPSAREQEMLEMVNRFRLHPREELEILVNLSGTTPATFANPSSDDFFVDSALSFFNVSASTLKSQFDLLNPVPALAWNTNLNDSALTHNDLMISFDSQSHALPGEPSLLQRVQNGGYVFFGGGTAGENIFAFAEESFYNHAAFVIDWGFTATGIQSPPGHRDNLMSTSFREIGISVVDESDSATSVGPTLVTEHLARANSRGPFLTGVAYRDVLANDDFYTPGEGLGCINIDVYQAGTETLIQSVQTWDSGGYSLLVGAGTYDVVAVDPRLGGEVRYSNVVVGGTNVKLDFLPLATLRTGDANGDGQVGAADYALWAAQFGQTGTCSTADFDASSSVGAGDYTLWAANFDISGAQSARRVPEPSPLELMLVGIGGIWLVSGRAGRRASTA